MSVYSTIRKAAAPITGGMIWPFTEEATSTAPAFSAFRPTRFIIGIVKVPVVTTLAIEEPEMRPVEAKAATAALDGPPGRCASSSTAPRLKRTERGRGGTKGGRGGK